MSTVGPYELNETGHKLCGYGGKQVQYTLINKKIYVQKRSNKN